MKHIELAKKLKVLADRGTGGEKVNAEKLLNKLLKKHGLTIEDIEAEKVQPYYFKASGIYAKLLHQIIARVNYNLKTYDVHLKYRKILPGNIFTECTTAEYLEIEEMFRVFKKLYKSENDIFYMAFLTANDLLAIPPKEKTTDDLTPKEIEEWTRAQQMASKIKTETIRKKLNAAET